MIEVILGTCGEDVSENGHGACMNFAKLPCLYMAVFLHVWALFYFIYSDVLFFLYQLHAYLEI